MSSGSCLRTIHGVCQGDRKQALVVETGGTRTIGVHAQSVRDLAMRKRFVLAEEVRYRARSVSRAAMSSSTFTGFVR